MKRSPKRGLGVDPAFDRGVVPEKLAQEFKVSPAVHYHYALKGFAAAMDEETADRLRRDPRVLAVEPDCPVVVNTQTNPTGILRMNIPNFPVAHINSTSYWGTANLTEWQVNYDDMGGSNIVTSQLVPVTQVSQPVDVAVAILDSGIDLIHPDLNVVAAVDFTGLGWGGDDCTGHGTAASGVVGAINNSLGVVGVAPGVRLWDVQVNCPGSASWSNVLAGVDYIAQHADRISVVNCSLGAAGGNVPVAATEAAVSTLVNLGVVFVAAAGNSGRDVAGSDGVYGLNPATGACDDSIPAALPEAMAVSAMDVHADQTASWSDYSYAPRPTNYVNSPGGAVDVAAPGEDSGDPSNGILTTFANESYATESGTSIAAPHVTGLVALYIAANGRATNAAGVYAIRQAIVNASLPQSQWNNANPNPMKNGVVPLPAPLAMPSENWVPQPAILRTTPTAGGFQLSFLAVPGYLYTAQYSDSLPATNWTDLGTSTNALGSTTLNTLTDPTPNPAGRFYRLEREPAP